MINTIESIFHVKYETTVCNYFIMQNDESAIQYTLNCSMNPLFKQKNVDFPLGFLLA